MHIQHVYLLTRKSVVLRNRLVFTILIFSLSGLIAPNYLAFALQPDDNQTQCRENQVLVFKYNSNNYICTDPTTAQKWVRYKIAEIVGDTSKETEEKPVVEPLEKEIGTALQEHKETKKDSETEDENNASDTTPTKSILDDVSLLFVQTANSGSFIKNDDNYTLTLTNVSPYTTYFSDRPLRISGVSSTEEFVESWCYGANSFDSDPPNAAINILGADDSEDVIIVELFNPVYDAEKETLQYDAKIISNSLSENLQNHQMRADASIPEEFDDVSLFIDNSARCTACRVGLSAALLAVGIGASVASGGTIEAAIPVLVSWGVAEGVSQGLSDGHWTNDLLTDWACKHIKDTC